MVESENSHNEVERTETKLKQKKESDKALFILGVIIGLGFSIVVLYALNANNKTESISFAFVGMMIAGCSTILGGLLGFLFGIPRTLQQDSIVQFHNNNQTESNIDTPQTDYRANTNLEQISDWLTKILVGVGLTQITNIPQALQQISYFAANGLGNTEVSRTFALAAIIFFLISGFLFGYLWTRLYLPGAFRQADLSALAIRVKKANTQAEQANEKINEIEKQLKIDGIAFSLALKQLNAGADEPPIKQEQLNKAIESASVPMKIQIFNLAQNQRSLNWISDKSKMELTIPIFKALAEEDKENKFHRNHGQLGYALKDKESPDWSSALDEINKAINIRGYWKKKGYTYYELNRAICRINLDEDYLQDKPSKQEVVDSILADLEAVAHIKPKSFFKSETTINKWLDLNNVDLENLKQRT